MRSDLIKLDVDLLHETELAYLVDNGDDEFWIPKSVCELGLSDDGTHHILELPEKIAVNKGLI